MINRTVNSVQDVAAWRLCMGCGACADACPNNAIALIDIPDRGIRPKIDPQKCKKCQTCIQVCPGIGMRHEKLNGVFLPELKTSWAPVLEVWEGYAADPEIRFKGSSGGLATAIAFFCLESQSMSGVLQIRDHPQIPWRNIPVFSSTKEQLLAATGSRYSPAAPCEKLQWLRDAEAPAVFIGKPCDVVALRKSQKMDVLIDQKIGLAISIFCAATPTTRGTMALLEEMNITPCRLDRLKYRGCGWPGMTEAKLKSDHCDIRSISYEQSWGRILSRHGQLRCRLCPDGTGEFADISCGDPWYRDITPDESGRSIILVRTNLGKAIIRKAIQKGCVHLEKVDPVVLALSQPSLLRKRRNLFGRLLAMRLLRIPVPHYSGFNLLANFNVLSIREKMRSVAGMLDRIVRKKWTRPLSNSQI